MIDSLVRSEVAAMKEFVRNDLLAESSGDEEEDVAIKVHFGTNNLHRAEQLCTFHLLKA